MVDNLELNWINIYNDIVNKDNASIVYRALNFINTDVEMEDNEGLPQSERVERVVSRLMALKEYKVIENWIYDATLEDV